MKKVLLSLSVGLLLAIGANAQVSYGLKAGVNLGKFSGNYSDNQKMITSFHVTGFADLPIANNFSIQPGVSLQGKGSSYSATTWGGVVETFNVDRNLMSVEIPVNAVYYIPAGNGNVFIGAGPYIGFNISGKQKMPDDLSDTEIKTDIKFSGDDKDMNLIDAGANFMAGYKFNNGLLINAGYGLGLTNLNPSDNSDNNYSSRTLNFGIGFQF
ncbi:porin family protein [Sphingobacterium hungaricum]|uniref:PorT family protein n=1 Tax=Sphingobacterium hungaricum TaxID=2082723 RepID=A0A928UWK8_9SPHI|nr:porin family protein [Sphingobacterium hungaricum]MBE8714565.1 PorT family protein [Sphingobacterium hungaricum]